MRCNEPAPHDPDETEELRERLRLLLLEKKRREEADSEEEDTESDEEDCSFDGRVSEE